MASKNSTLILASVAGVFMLGAVGAFAAYLTFAQGPDRSEQVAPTPSVVIPTAQAQTPPTSAPQATAAAKAPRIDLEKLTQAFEEHVTAEGAEDLNGFEKKVNDEKEEIYTGEEHVDVTLGTSGAVLGYVNKDEEPTYEESTDEKVFELNVDKKEEQVIARDPEHDYYYRHRPRSPGFVEGAIVGNMLSTQKTYYKGSYYQPPSGVTYKKSGYHERVRTTTSPSRSRSFRSGSYNSGSRSGSRSGGYGSGK